jgi:23S rRNA (uracil1939-C5)-methyltransferase
MSNICWARPMRLETVINRLGSQGDGIAETDGGPVYIPFTLPGERIAAEVDGMRGALTEIIEASPDRIPPICRHFGACGGCALQHFAWDAYRKWERQRVIEALAQQRIVAEVEPVLAFPPHSRRRAAFTAIKSGGTVQFGFRRALSHDVIDISECPIMMPAIEKALPALKALSVTLLPQGEARILVTACDEGLDVLIEPEGKQRPGALSTHLATHAQQAGIIRVGWRSDILLSAAPARVTLSGVVVDLPPGAFLQAVPEAEAAMARLVTEGVGKARKVADLFSGLGTFTFAFARKAAVAAAEFDATLLVALTLAARHAAGLKPITALRRDLMREPLSWQELNAFDAVVFDPPRAGAIAQAQALAKSKVPRVVAVSCNRATFARDARALVDGGYKLARITPIDQFIFSPHVELVASFTRT